MACSCLNDIFKLYFFGTHARILFKNSQLMQIKLAVTSKKVVLLVMQFPSMASVQEGALPNVPRASGLLYTPSPGMQSLGMMAPQSPSYASAMPPHSSSFVSAMPPGKYIIFVQIFSSSGLPIFIGSSFSYVQLNSFRRLHGDGDSRT